MTDLMLHLQKQWFDKIQSGEKTEEYRETTEYWKRRILGKTFDRIILVRGNYGNEKNVENVMVFPWMGYEIKTIKSWEGPEIVEVFAIKLRGEKNE